MCAQTEENGQDAGESEEPIQEEIGVTGDTIVIADGLGRIAEGLNAIAAAILKLAESQGEEPDNGFDPDPTEL